MRKNVFGRQLKRDVNERKALFKSLLSELVLHERIQTTEPKAKAIKASADKLVTKARKDALLARRLLSRELIPVAIGKMIVDIAPRFNGRNGGYTRIIRLTRRFNDDAQMVLLEWVEGAATKAVRQVAQVTKQARKTQRVENTTAMQKKTSKKAGEGKTEKKVSKAPAKSRSSARKK